ncbi:hypothetical protein CLOP_g11369 [Closterium sp. NIES-67]|nr:hypothetical protein CLOP_g11369 [Closterium sp. NIES-67]
MDAVYGLLSGSWLLGAPKVPEKAEPVDDVDKEAPKEWTTKYPFRSDDPTEQRLKQLLDAYEESSRQGASAASNATLLVFLSALVEAYADWFPPDPSADADDADDDAQGGEGGEGEGEAAGERLGHPLEVVRCVARQLAEFARVANSRGPSTSAEEQAANQDAPAGSAPEGVSRGSSSLGSTSLWIASLALGGGGTGEGGGADKGEAEEGRAEEEAAAWDRTMLALRAASIISRSAYNRKLLAFFRSVSAVIHILTGISADLRVAAAPIISHPLAPSPQPNPPRPTPGRSSSSSGRAPGSAWGAEFGVKQTGAERDGRGGGAAAAAGWLSGERRSVLVAVLLSCAMNALSLLANFLDAEMHRIAARDAFPPAHMPPLSSLAHTPARASPSPRSGAPSPRHLASPSARLRGSGRGSGRWRGRGLGFGEELAGTAWGGRAGGRGAGGDDPYERRREVRAIVEAVETKGLAALLALVPPLREIQTKRAAHCIEAGGTLLLALQVMRSVVYASVSARASFIASDGLHQALALITWPTHLLNCHLERIMELENDLFEEFSIQLLAFSVIQEAIFLNAAALEMVRDVQGFRCFSCFLRWAAFLFTKSSSALSPALVLPPQPCLLPSLSTSLSAPGDEVQVEVELPAIVARRDPKALLFDGSVGATPKRTPTAAAAAAAAAGPTLTLPASLRSSSNGGGGDKGRGSVLAAAGDGGWARERLLASATFRRLAAERNSTDEALMAWNPHAAVACTVLCRFLADSMPSATMRRGHGYGHAHGHDTGWDANPEEYREQAARSVAGALLGVFERQAVGDWHDEAAARMFRSLSPALQLFATHQLRRILGSLSSGADYFRSMRVWHALLSPVFFFFGARLRPRQVLPLAHLLGPKAAALALLPPMPAAAAGGQGMAAGGQGAAMGGGGGAASEGQWGQSFEFQRVSSVGESAAGADPGAGATEGGSGAVGSGSSSTGHALDLSLVDPSLEYVDVPVSVEAQRLRGDIVALVELAVSVDMGDDCLTECALLLAALEACCTEPAPAALLVHALLRLLQAGGSTMEAVRELGAAPRIAAIIDRQHAAAASAHPSATPPASPSQLSIPRSISLSDPSYRVPSALSTNGEEEEGRGASWGGVRGAVFALLEVALGDSDAALVHAAADPHVFLPLLRLLWDAGSREFALRVLILMMQAPFLDSSAGQPLLTCFFHLLSHAASLTQPGTALAVAGPGEEGDGREMAGVKQPGGADGRGREEKEERKRGESGGELEVEVVAEAGVRVDTGAAEMGSTGEGAAEDGRGEGGEPGEKEGERADAVGNESGDKVDESIQQRGPMEALEVAASGFAVEAAGGGEQGGREGLREVVAGRAVALLDDLLSSVPDIVTDPPAAALQQRCVEAGALQQVLAVLDARYDEGDSLTVALAALRCLTCLLAANQSSKAAMVRVAGAGYTALQRRIHALTGGRPCQAVLDAVLTMATDGADGGTLHNPMARATIQNGDALILWLSLLRTAPERQACVGLQQLQALLDDSTASCAECTRASLMWHLLHWLSTLDHDSPSATPHDSGLFTQALTGAGTGAWDKQQQVAAGGEGGGRGGRAQLVGAVALLVETLGRHSMSGKEITAVFHLLRQARSGSRAQHASLLLRTLLGAIKDEGPSGFFELNGIDSGFKLPPDLHFPGPRGYTFVCWLRIEAFPHSPASPFPSSPPGNPWAFDADGRLEEARAAGAEGGAREGWEASREGAMALFSWHTDLGAGCSAFLTPDDLLLHVGGAASREAVVGLPHQLRLKCWHHVAITHSAPTFSTPSTVHLFVDGQPVASSRASFPRIYDPLTRCTIAAWAPLPQAAPHARTLVDDDDEVTALGMAPPLCGQLGALHVLDDPLSPDQVVALHRLGPRHAHAFLPSELSLLPGSADSPVRALFDGKDSLAPRIALSLTAHATAGGHVLDGTPFWEQPGSTRKVCDAVMLPGVQVCQRHRLQDVLSCVGGVAVLFPLLTQLDDDDRNDGAGGEGEEGGVWEAGGTHLAVDVVCLLTEVMAGSAAAQQFMTVVGGFAVLNFLLQRVHPRHLTVSLVLSIESLTNSIAAERDSAMAEQLTRSAWSELYLDLALWIYAPYAVQREMLESLLRQVDRSPALLPAVCPLPRLLDLLRRFYWHVPQGRSVAGLKPLVHAVSRTVIGRRPEDADVAKLRLLLLRLAEYSVRDGFSLADVRAVAAFLEGSKDASSVRDVLLALLSLLSRPALLTSFTTHVYSLTGCHLFLNLLARPEEDVQSLGLRLIAALQGERRLRLIRAFSSSPAPTPSPSTTPPPITDDLAARALLQGAPSPSPSSSALVGGALPSPVGGGGASRERVREDVEQAEAMLGVLLGVMARHACRVTPLVHSILFDILLARPLPRPLPHRSSTVFSHHGPLSPMQASPSMRLLSPAASLSSSSSSLAYPSDLSSSHPLLPPASLDRPRVFVVPEAVALLLPLLAGGRAEGGVAGAAMKELADHVVGNTVNPRLLLQQKGWQMDLMALLVHMRSRLSPAPHPAATAAAARSSSPLGKGSTAANGWNGESRGGRGSAEEVGEEELEEAEVVWEQVRRLLLATHAHALQHSPTGWQHVADTVGAIRTFAQQGKLPYHLVLRPLLAELIAVQSGLSSRGGAAQQSTGRNNCLYLFALVDEFALHDSRRIFPAKELMTSGVVEAVDGLAGITTPRSHGPRTPHGPALPPSPHHSSPPLWHNSGGALWGEGGTSRGRGGMGEGEEGEEGEEEGLGGRAGQGGQREKGSVSGDDAYFRPLTPPGFARPLTPPGMSPLGAATRGFVAPAAGSGDEGGGEEEFRDMSLDVTSGRTPLELDSVATSVDLLDCNVDLDDSSGAGSGGSPVEDGRTRGGGVAAVGEEGEEKTRHGGGRAEEDTSSHPWDQLLQAEDAEFRWKAYDGFWALLTLLHNKADAAAALSAGLFRSFPRSSSSTALPLSRLLPLAPPAPSKVDLDAVLGADGGGHWGCSTEERLEQLGKEKCPRVVFRLVLLYAYEATLEGLQRCLHQFTVLIPVMLGDDSEGQRNRFHLFLWSLVHAHSAIGHMDDGVRGDVLCQAVHDIVVSSAALFAHPIRAGLRITPSNSGSDEDDDLEAARKLVQQQRVEAAVEEEIGHMLSAVAQWDNELSQARHEHETVRAQRMRQQGAFQELQRIALSDLLDSDSRRRAAARISYDEQQERVKGVWEQLYREMTSERGPWYSPPSSSSSIGPLVPGTTPPTTLSSSPAVQRWKLDKSEDAQRRRFRLRPHLRFDQAMCRPPVEGGRGTGKGGAGAEEKEVGGEGEPGREVVARVRAAAAAVAGREGRVGGLAENASIRVEKDLLEEVAMLTEETRTAQEGAGAGGPGAVVAGAGAGGGGEVGVRSGGSQLGLRFDTDDEVVTSLPCVMLTAKRKLGGRMELRHRTLHFFADFVFEGTAGSSLFAADGTLRPPQGGGGEAERGAPKVGPRERWRRVTQRLLLVAKLQPTEKTLGRASVRAAKDPDVLEEVKMHRQWPLDELSLIRVTRFLLRHTALELSFTSPAARPPALFTFASPRLAADFASKIAAVANASARSSRARGEHVMVVDRRRAAERAEKAAAAWRARELSNFEYLMALNTLAGRTYNDLAQYPVFPWVIADYESEHLDLTREETFRDLSKPVGALNPKRLEMFRERAESFRDPDIPSFLYGSHYSTAGIVLFYLLRLEPFATLSCRLQGGKFDHADRLFHSVAVTWANCLTNTSDVKELTPEFFYQPEFLVNSNHLYLGQCQDGSQLNDVRLPPWAKGSPELFIQLNREALESEWVSAHLHRWIDLIFGYQQRGLAAMEADNVFYYLTYENAVDMDALTSPIDRAAIEEQIAAFGQTPAQLFRRPHEPRGPPLRAARPLLHRPASLVLSAVVPACPPAGGGGEVGEVLRQQWEVGVVFVGVAQGRVVTVTRGQCMAARMWNTPASSGYQVMASDAPFSLSEPLISRRIGPPFASTSADVSPNCFALLRGASSPFLLSAAHWDCATRLVAVSDGRTVQAVRQHTDVVTCLSASSDGLWMATGSRDTTVMVWHVDRAQPRPSADPVLPCKPHVVLCGHDDVVTQVLAASPLDLVLSASLDGSLLLHALSSGRFIRCIRHPRRHAVQRMAVSQLALVAVHSDADGWLRVASINGKWLAATPTGAAAAATEKHTECGASSGDTSAGVSNGGGSCVSGFGSESTDGQQGQALVPSAASAPLSPPVASTAAAAAAGDSVTCMAASACGEFLVTAGAAGRVTVRSFYSLATVAVYEGVGVAACSIAVTREDAILMGLEDGRLLLYSLGADAATD